MGGSFKVDLKIEGTNVRKIAIGNSQDRGARDYQEDSFGFSSLDSSTVLQYGFTAVVADGMGGLSCGDKVSAYTVSAILETNICSDGLPPHVSFIRRIREINKNVAGSGLGGGCTAAAVLCTKSGIYWCSVGDSRIYLYRDSSLCRLTEDSDYHNVLFDQVINGDMSFTQAASDPQKDSLAHYIGYNGEITPDVNIRPFIPRRGDRILICSDGVYNALSDEELSRSLLLHAQEAADDIMSRIILKNYSNQDNFTSVVLEFI